MEIMGGCLAPEKSWWYLVDFVWKRGKWICENPGHDEDLVAKNSQGETVSLKYLLANKAQSMLRVHLAPNGNNLKEIEYLKKNPNGQN